MAHGTLYLFGQDIPPSQEESDDERLEDNLSPESQFPLLKWQANPVDFTWTFPPRWTALAPAGWNFPDEDWITFRRVGSLTSFIGKLMPTPWCLTTYNELAILFVFHGLRTTVFSR